MQIDKDSSCVGTLTPSVKSGIENLGHLSIDFRS